MKAKLKCFITLLMFGIFALLICVSVSADKTSDIAFTVTLSDGTVNEYDASANFSSIVSNAPSDSLITLCTGIHVSRGIEVLGTPDAHKEITIDLAGYGIYSTSKGMVSTLFGVHDYATLNITSSKPNAFLYMIDTDTNSTQGGNIFGIMGVDALVNFGGTVTIGDTKYPGSNISTFSSCFVDIRHMGTIGFNGDGGYHFANIADWAGFINPRSGDGIITIKNSDILVDQNSNLIYSTENTASLYMENCLITRLDGECKPLLTDAQCSIYFKNCVSNYSLTASKGELYGNIYLEGENIFGYDVSFNSAIVSGGEGLVAARTNSVRELVFGGVDYWRYDNSGLLNKLYESIPEISNACVIVPSEDVYKCTWRYDADEVEEYWVTGVVPEPHTSVLGLAREGIYKRGWLKTEMNEDGVVYKATYVADFKIKVGCEYVNGNLCYNVYIPAFIVDNDYINYAEGKIDGSGFTYKDWDEAEINGERFYKYTTMNVDKEDADRILEISIPCDYYENNKPIKIEGVWRINLSQYIDMVYENSDEYSEEQMDAIEKIKAEYLSDVPSSDDE